MYHIFMAGSSLGSKKLFSSPICYITDLLDIKNVNVKHLLKIQPIQTLLRFNKVYGFVPFLYRDTAYSIFFYIEDETLPKGSLP